MVMSAVSARLQIGLSTVGDNARRTIDASDLVTMMWHDAGLLFTLVGPPAIFGAIVSVAASAAQVGGAYSPESRAAQLEPAQPRDGFQKFAPIQALPELGKSLLSMAVMGTVAYLIVAPFLAQAPVLMEMTPAASAAAGWDRLSTLLWRASLALVALGGGRLRLAALALVQRTQDDAPGSARRVEAERRQPGNQGRVSGRSSAR